MGRHGGGRVLVFGDAVRPDDHAGPAGGFQRAAEGQRRVGAAVGANLGPQREHDAVVVDRSLHPVVVVAGVHVGEQGAVAVLDPLHGPAQAQRERGADELLGVQRRLDAETAAHVGNHDPQGRLRNIEELGQGCPQQMVYLGRGVEDQVGRLLGHGKAPAGLDRHSGHTVRVEVLCDHVGSRIESGGHIVGGEPALEIDVARHGRVDLRGGGIGGFVNVGDRGKRLVVDFHQLDAVFGEILALGHHHSNRLARKPHLVHCQHVAGVEAVAGQLDLGSDRLHHACEIRTGEHIDHAVERHCFARVDRGDPSVGVGAEHEGEVQGVKRRGQVVDEAALASQQVLVFPAQHALPDSAVLVAAHAGFLRRSSTAASATASTMLA